MNSYVVLFFNFQIRPRLCCQWEITTQSPTMHVWNTTEFAVWIMEDSTSVLREHLRTC